MPAVMRAISLFTGAGGMDLRYRMCGNGVVTPVAEWIGRRLAAVIREETAA